MAAVPGTATGDLDRRVGIDRAGARVDLQQPDSPTPPVLHENAAFADRQMTADFPQIDGLRIGQPGRNSRAVGAISGAGGERHDPQPSIASHERYPVLAKFLGEEDDPLAVQCPLWTIAGELAVGSEDQLASVIRTGEDRRREVLALRR